MAAFLEYLRKSILGEPGTMSLSKWKYLQAVKKMNDGRKIGPIRKAYLKQEIRYRLRTMDRRRCLPVIRIRVRLKTKTIWNRGTYIKVWVGPYDKHRTFFYRGQYP